MKGKEGIGREMNGMEAKGINRGKEWRGRGGGMTVGRVESGGGKFPWEVLQH